MAGRKLHRTISTNSLNLQKKYLYRLTWKDNEMGGDIGRGIFSIVFMRILRIHSIKFFTPSSFFCKKSPIPVIFLAQKGCPIISEKVFAPSFFFLPKTLFWNTTFYTFCMGNPGDRFWAMYFYFSLDVILHFTFFDFDFFSTLIFSKFYFFIYFFFVPMYLSEP